MAVNIRRKRFYEKRIYGKRGFTLKGRLGELLKSYEGSLYGYIALGNLIYLDAIPPSALKEIRGLLPDGNKKDAQNDSPTLSQFCKWDIPGLYFHGYRIAPERHDERVTIEGFYCPPEYAEQALALCAKPPQERNIIEHPKLGKVFRAWWD